MKYKLVSFDLMGSLIKSDEHIWNVIHDKLGVDPEERKNAYNDFKEGRISYQDWVAHNVNLWAKKGATKDDLMDAVAELELQEGALETLQRLKNNHCLIILSGGLNFVIEKIFRQHQTLFDHVFINKLVFGEGGLIAGGKATPYDMDKKADSLRLVAEQEGIDISQCVFVGNNKNDIEVAKIAGLSIAFNSKSDELSEVCNVAVNSDSLVSILDYILVE
ncbi:HAD-IB family phosphatase [archaeon]|nr:HAD-IB family phosphatase [archaeon]MBL7057154.1 HAD-IB family phosphatase [Candidatus Woesearchaeota archaeon]